MAKLTIGFAVVLIVLGIAAYIGSGAASFTALIPSFFGIVMLGLGVLALRESLRKHAMHGAAGLALIGLIATARGLLGAITLATGGTVARPSATVVQAIMALLCLGFVILCVRSFVKARTSAA